MHETDLLVLSHNFSTISLQMLLFLKEVLDGHEVEKEDTVATYLDCEEYNALHYTARFVLHSLAKTLEYPTKISCYCASEK